jgi:hypothetical protein
MQISITPNEIAEAFRTQFPQQYEIAMLRITVEKQRQRVDELEAENDDGPSLPDDDK